MDVLQQIINMDKLAASRAEKTVEQERRLSDEQGDRAAAEREKLVSAEREKVERFVREQEQKLSDKLSRAEKSREEQCAQLDERFNSRRSEWKSEILTRITEG